MCTKVVRRSCINFSLDYSAFSFSGHGDDTIQSAEIYTLAKKIVYLNKCLYNYRMHSGMTSRYDPNYYNIFKQIFKELEQYQKKWQLDNFRILMASQLFQTVGRSITQTTYGNLKVEEQKKFLKSIRDDDFLIKYESYYLKCKKNLNLKYRGILFLFLL